MIYLDHNATTPVLPAVWEAMERIATATPLNPSSAHGAGRRAQVELERAREAVASLIGAEPGQIIFTSSGTEANNAVLRHGVQDGAIVTSLVEHSSILATIEQLEAQGTPIYRILPDIEGRVTPDAVAAALDEAVHVGPIGLVSVQWVNNETGVVQPIDAIAALCRDRGVPFHTDAAQAVGKLAVDVSAVPVDFLTLTGHKFHAPTGVGALYARTNVRPWFYGGAQEHGRRAGTENLIGIAGLGAAAALRHSELAQVQRHLASLRGTFEAQIINRYPWVRINGSDPRVANTSNLQFGRLDGEAMLAQLDAAGICVSQASACANQRPTPSHVLQAMGRTEAEAYASIRVSFGITNTHTELDEALEHLFSIVDRLSALEALA